MTPLQQKGFQRDAFIVGLVQRHKALTADQVEILAFRGMASRYRKARERLLMLTETKALSRTRMDDSRWAYHLNQRPGQLAHLIAVNWALIHVQAKLRGYEALSHVEYEPDYGLLRADAFLGVRNRLANETHFSFLEADLSERNRFDKVSKYCRLYETEAYSSHWWVQEAKRFPMVIIIADRPARVRHVRECVEKDNLASLRFRVLSLDEVRKGCQEWANTCSNSSSAWASKSGLSHGAQ